MKNKERGITLIALVITIIVLLILAGISISTLMGDNGVLTQSINAKTKYVYAQDKEALDIIALGVTAENMGKRPFNDMWDDFEKDKNGENQTVQELLYPTTKPNAEDMDKYTWIKIKTVNDNIFIYDLTEGKIKTYEDSEFSKSYKITYYANDGEFSDGDTKKEEKNINYNEAKIIYTGNDLPIRNKYGFVGWNTKEDGTGTDYNAGQEYRIKDNIELYAKWESQVYNVNVKYFLENANDDNFTLDTTKEEKENPVANTYTQVDKLANTVEYMNYQKASTDSEGKNVVTEITGKKGDEKELYMFYTRDRYNIVYDANDGEFSDGSTKKEDKKKYGQTNFALISDKPTRTGYEFENWNTKKDGTGTDYESNSSYDTNANLTLYAQWTPKTYTVSFDSDGGSSCTVQDATYDSKYGTLPTPTKTGYDFGGWYTEMSFSNKVTSETVVATASDHTLYAQWTIKTYTVTYSGSNITKTSAPTSATYNTKFSATITASSGYYISAYSVKVGSTTLTSGTHYTYNTLTGALSINAASVTGNITITITTTTLSSQKNLINNGASTGYNWAWDLSNGYKRSIGEVGSGDGTLNIVYYKTTESGSTPGYIYGYTTIGKGIFLKNYKYITVKCHLYSFEGDSTASVNFGIGTSSTSISAVSGGKYYDNDGKGVTIEKKLTIPTSSLNDNTTYYFVFKIQKTDTYAYTSLEGKQVYLHN